MKPVDPRVEHNSAILPSGSRWAFLSALERKGRTQLRDLFGQSASAVSDQGFFALGNFAVNTILARQMSQATFGRFSAAFAAFLLLSTVYCAFVVDPMLIFGVSTVSGLQKSYVRRVISLHWRTALALSISLVGVGFIRGRMDPGQGAFAAYIGWAIAAPAVLRLWLARRTAYLVMKPQIAAFAGAIYLAIIATLLLALGDSMAANVVAPCLLVAVTSVGVAIGLHRSLPLLDTAPSSAASDNILKAHWKFGKWASIAGVLSLFPDYVYFFVLSPELCGEYRALLNVILPLSQVYNALGVLMMSYFARHRDKPDFSRTVWRTAGAFCGVAILLAGLTALVGGAIFSRLYGGKYDLSLKFLWPLTVVSALFALRIVSDAVLRALENVTAMATIAVIGATAALAVGAPLAIRYGIFGAVYGDLLVYLVTTVAIAVLWIRRFRRTRLQSKSDGVAPGTPATTRSQLAPGEAPLQSFIES